MDDRIGYFKCCSLVQLMFQTFFVWISSVFYALNFGVKKCKTHFVNSMMQRTGQKVIKVVDKNSHAEVRQKSSSYSNLAEKLISIKQKRKHHFIILSGRTRQGNQFLFPTSINRNFVTYFDGNRTCTPVFFLSSRYKSTCYHLLSDHATKTYNF